MQSVLDNKVGKYSRTNGPSSYIIIFDNIDDQVERKKKLNVDNQEVQTEAYYDKLFIEAELTIFKSERKSIHHDYFPVKMWALYWYKRPFINISSIII